MDADLPLLARQPAHPLPPVSPQARWQVRLLGGLDLSDGRQRLTRLPSRAVTLLLARLAMQPQRAHSREELIDLLWPGVALDVGRNRLRQALSTLKSVLEPPGGLAAPVLDADRQSLRLVPGALACDAVVFEDAMRRSDWAAAVAWYRGELLPGLYDEWVHEARLQFAGQHQRALDRLPAGGPAPERAVGRGSGDERPASTAADACDPTPLPLYLTQPFGLDDRVAHLDAVVAEHRLVTLVGPGGSGKTRLATEFARAQRQGRHGRRPATGADAVIFVSLVDCTTDAQWLRALAGSLHLRVDDAGPDALVAAIAEALSGRRTLLVLDNFEQLVDAAVQPVARLASSVDQLHLVVTSRRALGLDGEKLFEVHALPLPDEAMDLAAAADNPAVALFVDRARAARSDFHLGERNRAALIELAIALDGMPLAIELAASRVRSFTPAQMLHRLRHEPYATRLDLLARRGPRSAADTRHASMQRVVEWSWQALEPGPRRLLARLTLFRGGCTAEAACAVADGDGPEGDAALWLDDLVAHSMVRMLELGDGPPRFMLYEPIRDFAASHLTAAEAGAARGRLRRWLLEWVAANRQAPARRIAPELGNLLAAMADAVADGAPTDALTLAVALRDFWQTDGLPPASIDVLEAAAAAIDDAGLLADTHELLASARFESGDALRAQHHADLALRFAGDDPSRRARARLSQAALLVHGERRDHGQRALLAEALALAEACGDLAAQADALQMMGVVTSRFDRDPAAAEPMFARSQRLCEQLGDRRRAHARLHNRAQCWVHLGRAADALDCLAICARAAREDGDWVGQVMAALSTGVANASLRRWAASAEAFRMAARIAWQRHQTHSLAYALWGLCHVMARLRQPEDAGRLMAFAAAFWVLRFAELTDDDRRYVRRVRGLVRRQVGPVRAEALSIEGGGLGLSEAVSLALSEAPAVMPPA